MRALRYLYRSINLLNILLLLMIVSVIVFAVSPLFRMKVKYTLPVGKAKVADQSAPSKETVQTTSPADYVIVSENNLFHPDRMIPPEKKDEKLLPRPELVLFGTVVSDGVSVAYIEDKKSPRTSPGRGKRQSVVRKGDVLGGFVLKDIETDRIILSRGEETMVVRLTEAGKQREGATTGLPGKPQASKPGAASFQAAPGPVSSPAVPSPLASRAPAGPISPPSAAAATPSTPTLPGATPSRQQRLLEVQQMKAARPTGP
jgi:type II secretory pathway component PulC